MALGSKRKMCRLQWQTALTKSSDSTCSKQHGVLQRQWRDPNQQCTTTGFNDYKMNASVFGLILEGFKMVICVFYPIWCSYKVVEAKKFDNDLVLWLSFWIIQAVILKVEDIVSSILLLWFGRLPLISVYKLLRICFFVWLMHPNYKGSLWIY